MESPAPAYSVQASPYFPINVNVSEACAEGVCSPFCFMFCFPFPPPPPYDMMSRGSGDSTFSPLVIAIIGILVSAILLVTYYTLVAKYCRNWDEFRRRLHRASGERFDDDDMNPNAAVESWPVFRDGLEEAVINSIPVHKYKKGDGFVDCSDCSVCLSEFKEDETVRLLPKCSHAFHVPCIDKWLNCHSNCPLCRANIVAPVPEARVSIVDSFRENNHSFRASEAHSSRFDERDMDKELIEVSASSAAVIPGFRAMSDLATTHRWRNSEAEVDLEDALRRSFSVDSRNAFGKFGAEDQDGVIASSCERRHPYFKGLWKQKDRLGETSSKSGILHHVKDPLAMKRSFSGSKLFLSRNRNSILPV